MTRKVVVSCLLMYVFVAGCSESREGRTAEPEKEVDSGRSNSLGVSDGRTAPDLPDAALRNSPQGAELFVRHYLRLRNFASSTGEVSAFRSATRNCRGCEKYADLYQSTYRNGGYIRSTGWTVRSVDIIEEGRRVSIALVTVDSPPMQFRRSGDSELEKGGGGVYKLRFEVQRHGGNGWVVTEFGVQTTPEDL